MTRIDHRLKPPRALLFDMDGVLVDSEELHWESVLDVLRDHLGADAPSLPPRIGWGDHDLWEELRDQFKLKGTAIALTEERGIWAIKRLMAKPPPAMPHALDAIRDWRLLSPTLPLVVVSASPKNQMVQSLASFTDHIGQPLFNAYISGVDDVSYNKPAPDAYLKAISQLGLSPEECWISEDSATGLTAALASGAQVIAMGAHSASRALIQRCHLSLNSLDELCDVWRSLTSQARSLT